MSFPENNRILVVDDNPAIHDDFRKILAPNTGRAADLDAAEAILFAAPQRASARKHFEIDSAFQGEEAVQKVRAAEAEARPYAMAFVDVRMPPGWDGVETITRLWEAAPDLQVVLCTAYSDYSWQDIADRVIAAHNMVVLKKPFDNIEVLQLAHALCHKWVVTQEANAQLTRLNEMVQIRTHELDRANAELWKEIAERRTAEEVLRDSEERFRAFMDNSPVIAYIKDHDGRYVYLNRQFETQFGMTMAEWVGRTDAEAWPQHIAEPIRANDIAVFNSEQPREFIEKIPVPNGSSDEWLVFRFTIRDRTGQKFVGGVGIDITERTRLEAQRRQSQKLEAVGQLAGGVAHDFNNILAVIIGYTESALARLEPGSTFEQPLSEIMKAANRGTGLIGQLLAFSRKQVVSPRVVDVNSALIDIDKILHRLIKENIYLTLLLSPETLCIRADPGQVEQVVMNLVVNARDAMPDGGELRIETQAVDLSAAEAERHGVSPGDYVVVQISDTGTGMSAETQAHVFEPFFTTKAAGEGTGLGLSTCYGIAQQNGGFITIRSALGEGSTFCVYLPRIDATPDAAQPRLTSGELPRGNESVLVVEDDDALRDLTVDTLRELGYSVSEAPDGESAQRLLMENGAVDLVLTDVGMPKMDGASLTNWIEAERPNVKVLLVSGYAGDSRLRDEDLGLDHRFLAKPFTRSQLAASVRKALDQPEPANHSRG
jgi:two-component system, cell cycle sensor histidine kinase and response regulator CckA